MKPAKEHTERLIFFIHLPKTSGTTLLELMTNQYPSSALQLVYGNEKEAMTNLSQDTTGNIRCVYGHFMFGLHQYTSRPFSYAAMLRDPVDRVISLYYFHKEKLSHTTLQQFVSSDFPEVENHQTLYLAGGQFDLQRAKANLATYFTVVGITERFADSLFLLIKELGWSNIDAYWFTNRTPNRPHKDEISRDALELIMKKNQLDLQLYAYAKQLFEEKMANLDASTRMERDHFLKNVKAIGG
ncbi:sulfotransferase family protein [Brevibacillus humidisoli]|uniref:sulfotransferase family 2 domain-containing protein n=1 Tax=Brevibacillus humidisoli TaxID=2895522 RepID=UPI001E3C2F67|nr:sulfotransferase family 2 domain-containing protein [Brevibacillus humidisoli]UFJ42542.1 sulfotransferase family protein [Brevibacillus humidisoli]